ncbi:MAG: hypothetical protein B6I19_05095 [Bacteroidetes bacterium 4572_114]|nr:MAG: hypothetical protein B6I19_05095 [Bacteroidetes bacterium 4572_114]
MKKIKLNFALLALLSFGLLMTSCKKDDQTIIEDTDTSSAEYDALAEGIFNDVGNITDEAYYLNSGNYKSTDGDTLFLGQCATVILDTVVFPHELTIDFGEENCLCLDGRYRRGKIINTGLITLAENGGIISWNASKEREWVEGSNTWNRWDDVYHITGTADGVRVSGQSWTKEIIIPLRRELVCRFFVSGSVEIIPEERPARLLDYGDGQCDNLATVTINGRTYTIHLK